MAESSVELLNKLEIEAEISINGYIFYLELPLPNGWQSNVLALNILKTCYWPEELLKQFGEGKIKITLEKI